MSPHAPGMRERIGPALLHKDIKRFPKPIRDIIVDLVSNYEVTHRVQKDGQHVLLYSGKEGERPLKVGAQRNPPATLRYLRDWIAEHVPDYYNDEKEQTVQATFKCTQGCKDAAFTSIEEINAHYAEQHSPEPTEWVEPKAKPEDSSWAKEKAIAGIAAANEAGRQLGEAIKAHAEIEWVPYVYPSSGKTSEFLEQGVDVDPPILRCKAEGCDYQRVGKFTGAHLHENSHTSAGAKQREAARKKAADSRRKAAGSNSQVREALEVLAAASGLVVMTEDEVLDTTECEALQAEVDRLRKELDEVNAKMALIREATGL